MKRTAKITDRTDGCLVCEYRYTFESGDHPDEAEYRAQDIALPEVGKTYMMATRENVGPNDPGDGPQKLLFDADNGEGWPGNSDTAQCRYHGWRGTTDDVYVRACGRRVCEAADVTGSRSRKVRIVFGRDLAEEEE